MRSNQAPIVLFSVTVHTWQSSSSRSGAVGSRRTMKVETAHFFTGEHWMTFWSPD
jgi:hypothetical protein